MNKQLHSKTTGFGYYHVEVLPEDRLIIMRSNNERAFLIAQLQDLLSPRLLLNETDTHRQLASCIDLLGFSLTKNSIQLLLFSIDSSIVHYFTNCLVGRLEQFKSEFQTARSNGTNRVYINKLAGPHDALAWSLKLHLSHEDWEYDRYSSIGFYLHDRRGDWMRTWRLSRLYENNPENYLMLMCKKIEEKSSSLAHGTMGYGGR